MEDGGLRDRRDAERQGQREAGHDHTQHSDISRLMLRSPNGGDGRTSDYRNNSTVSDYRKKK
jgi:hypothetical protein